MGQGAAALQQQQQQQQQQRDGFAGLRNAAETEQQQQQSEAARLPVREGEIKVLFFVSLNFILLILPACTSFVNITHSLFSVSYDVCVLRYLTLLFEFVCGEREFLDLNNLAVSFCYSLCFSHLHRAMGLRWLSKRRNCHSPRKLVRVVWGLSWLVCPTRGFRQC